LAQTIKKKLQNQGWVANLELGFQVDGRRTVLAERKRYGPLTIQRPFYPEGEVCHVYILHPPGGVVAGDSLHVTVAIDHHAHALITTPGATKFYRSSGNRATLKQTIKVASQGCIEWFPLENIYFPGTIANLDTHIEIAENAIVAAWDIQCFGRPSLAETFDHGEINIGTQLWRKNTPLLIERLKVDKEYINLSSLLRGSPVNATLIITQAHQQALETSRKHLIADQRNVSGATLVEDILVIRYLGNSTALARQLFTRIWFDLRKEIIGKSPQLPRIWNT